MRRLLFLVLVVVAALLAVNTVVTDNETKPAKADIGRVLDLRGGDLQVKEDGDAARPALVLLHGFASSLHWWDAAARSLARGFHVVRIDLLGHGGSEKPKSGYSMANQARLVEAALARMGVRRAIVVGHSMGGTVATAIAERSPALISGLVLVGTPPDDEAGELPFLARLGFVPVIGEAIRRLVPDSVVRDNLEDAFAPGFDVPDRFVSDFRRMTYSSYDGSHEESDRFQERRPIRERLAAAAKQLLVVFGRKDEIVDPDSAREYESVPGARVEYLGASGHSPMVEQPGEVARLLRDFANELDRRPAERSAQRATAP